jgi:poly-gamma-glutamate synthesis protein (capsule biosynthesis protein)
MMKITKTRRNKRRQGLLWGIIGLVISLGALVFVWYSNQPRESTVSTIEQAPAPEELAVRPVTKISLDLVGDVNFADGWGVDYANAHDNSVAAAFSPEILEHLRSADVTYANHEFTMSTRGAKLNKRYTFRADPAKVDYWQQLGVDVVGLANNHAYDYGEAAFLDTLDILDANQIKHVGAGRNLAEAMAPAYFDFAGYQVALVAADRSQKGAEVRAAVASASTPGVLFCFDDAQFLEAVQAARAKADFVIAIPHWGTESTTKLETVQISLGQKLIDAGADVVVGAHPHALQGMDFYRGKLIAYSLGNFWFNQNSDQTMILNVTITDGQPSYQMIPALQSGQQVRTSAQISAEVINTMRRLSPNVDIDDTGMIKAQ